MSMKPRHISRHHLFPEFCDWVVSVFTQHVTPEPGRAGILDEDGRVIAPAPDLRSSTIRAITVGEEIDDLTATLREIIWHANDERFGFDLNAIQRVQLAEYQGSRWDHFGWHVDEMKNSAAEVHRKLTAVAQLSEPEEYDGGQLEFADSLEPLPAAFQKRGSIVVFPSIVEHRVTPVTSGTRLSLTAWAIGPAWTEEELKGVAA